MHHLMPKSPDGAGVPPHQVPTPATADAETASALTCPHTGNDCPALAALFASLAPAGDEAQAWVQGLAPCTDCRTAFAAGRDRLRHVRLGQREREVLVAAATGEAFVVTEPGMSRSLSASRRRAAQALSRAGLVAPVPMPDNSDGSRMARPPARRATVTITAFGTYVMAAYGRFIATGKPVRWTRPARGMDLPGRDPAELVDAALARTESALRETLTDLMAVLVAAIARPHKNPGLLDAVTRRLEQKATLFKAVLEPARRASGAPVRAA